MSHWNTQRIFENIRNITSVQPLSVWWNLKFGESSFESEAICLLFRPNGAVVLKIYMKLVNPDKHLPPDNQRFAWLLRYMKEKDAITKKYTQKIWTKLNMQEGTA